MADRFGLSSCIFLTLLSFISLADKICDGPTCDLDQVEGLEMLQMHSAKITTATEAASLSTPGDAASQKPDIEARLRDADAIMQQAMAALDADILVGDNSQEVKAAKKKAEAEAAAKKKADSEKVAATEKAEATQAANETAAAQAEAEAAAVEKAAAGEKATAEKIDLEMAAVEKIAREKAAIEKIAREKAELAKAAESRAAAEAHKKAEAEKDRLAEDSLRGLPVRPARFQEQSEAVELPYILRPGAATTVAPTTKACSDYLARDWQKFQEGKNIFTSISGKFYWVNTCNKCGLNFCSGMATTPVPAVCGSQVPPAGALASYMIPESACSAKACSGSLLRDWQKFQVGKNIFTSISGKFYYVNTCNKCGLNFCSGMSTTPVPSVCGSQVPPAGALANYMIPDSACRAKAATTTAAPTTTMAATTTAAPTTTMAATFPPTVAPTPAPTPLVKVCGWKNKGRLENDMGTSLKGWDKGKDVESCKKACDADKRCNSFSHSTQKGGMCYLKAKVVDENTPAKPNKLWVTYYKLKCSEVKATPPPPPAPTLPPPTPAPFITAVAPFDCSTYRGAIQILKEWGKGFAVKALSIDTGKYNTIFMIKKDATNPPYKDLNACAINPDDSILYCILVLDVSYVTRIDKDKVEFVAKIPSYELYNTATFSPEGVFYAGTGAAQFFVLANLSSTVGYANQKDKRILNRMGEKRTRPKGFLTSADVVVVTEDLEKTGTQENYMIVVNKGLIQVAKHNGTRFSPQTWIIPYNKGDKPGQNHDIMGAGWTFQGKVFVANNRGEGVFQLNVTKLDLTQPIKKLSPFVLDKVGMSDPSGYNDGANCMNAPDPWKTTVAPFDCKSHGEPLQVMRNYTFGYHIKKLHWKTGVYSPIFDLPFSKTSPPYKYLNAVGINPKDGIPYGCFMFDEYPANFYIVRFDATGFEYVYKVLGKWDPIAGTFGEEGDYFFMHSPSDDVGNPVLWSLKDLDSTKGYLNYSDPALPVIKNIKGLNLRKYTQIADIVAIKHDFDQDGDKDEYIFGMNRDEQVMVVRWEGVNGENSKTWTMTTNDVLGAHYAYENFGAAWNYEGRVFFSSNDGVGVFETVMIDFRRSRITLKKVGQSTRVYNNDGFNCWKLDAPFPEPDTNVTIISAFRS